MSTPATGDLETIRNLVDKLGLPEVLRLKLRVEYFHVYWWVLTPTLGEPQVLVTNYIGLPIALAHWETEVEQRWGLYISAEGGVADWECYDRMRCNSHVCEYEIGNTLARLTAKARALEDGVRAVGQDA